MKNLVLDESRFIRLLGELIALGPRLQNSPAAGLVPEERLAVEVVERALAPHIESGFIRAERLAGTGHAARPNLVLRIDGSEKGHIGFVGAHFDIVPADREKEGWERDPFRLEVGKDGMLHGRGVTDCLGHVALITELLAQMAERKLRPRRSLEVVLISNEEETPVPEIGLDYAVAAGALEELKDGTIYWLDSSDFGPTVGTGGMATWKLRVDGVAGHSGMTENCVNALELAMASSRALVDWFEKKFPPQADEMRWGFKSASTLKATLIRVPNDKVTKIPGIAEIDGDIRLTPFYEIREAIDGAVAFIAELDRRIASGDPPSGFPRTTTVSGERGKLRLTSNGRSIEGIACDLDSSGLAALTRAIKNARPGIEPEPFSTTGSLPLVRDLQRRGFDVQITGFGSGRYYHAPNECGELEHFRQGFRILAELLG